MDTQSAPNFTIEISVTESNVISTVSSHVNSQKLAEVDICSRADADIKLVIASTDGIAHFRVNSHVLCVASPVFKAMLGSNSKFKEAANLAERRPSEQPLEIQLGDDNPNALAVILWAIHCRWDMVPPTLTQDRLYEIAIIVDKYDMACSINIITKQWIQHLDPLENQVPLDPMWLFITFALRVTEIFKCASTEAILHSSISDTGDLKFKAKIDEEEPLSPSYPHVPQRILTQISNIRSEIVDNIFNEAKLILEKYSKFTGSECKGGKDAPIGSACDAVIFGLCSSTFLNGGILDAAFSTSCSLNYLSNSVQGMKDLPRFYLADLEFDCCNNPRLNNSSYGYASKNCCSCGKKYSRPGTAPSTHATTCSPLPEFKKKVSTLIGEVKGLDLKEFIRPSEGRTPASRSPDMLVDLWESLVYADVAS